MSDFPYPTNLRSVGPWARSAGVSPSEGRIRFAQYGILKAIASSRKLRSLLVLKGGNALDFVWNPNRSTQDLDFSVFPMSDDSALSEGRLRSLLLGPVTTVGRRLGVEYLINKIRQNPPGSDKTFITYQSSISYAFSDQPRLLLRIQEGRPSPQSIRLDISVNEPICETSLIRLDEESTLEVSTMEDILAEKLRALLQQPIRNRSRGQDLLDIAVARSMAPGLDTNKIRGFLLVKAKARGIVPSRASFHDPDVIARARETYSPLRNMTRVQFAEFDDAVSTLFDLVDALDLPPG